MGSTSELSQVALDLLENGKIQVIRLNGERVALSAPAVDTLIELGRNLKGKTVSFERNSSGLKITVPAAGLEGLPTRREFLKQVGGAVVGAAAVSAGVDAVLPQPSAAERGRIQLAQYARNPNLIGVLSAQARPAKTVDVTGFLPDFKELVRQAGYAEGRALLVSTAAPAELPQRTVKIYIDSRWRTAIQEQLEGLKEAGWNVTFVTDPEQAHTADILIGDDSIKPSRDQILLQVNDQTSYYVDKALLLHLANYPEEGLGLLFRGGETFIVGLRVKGRGDFNEASLIFA